MIQYTDICDTFLATRETPNHELVRENVIAIVKTVKTVKEIENLKYIYSSKIEDILMQLRIALLYDCVTS